MNSFTTHLWTEKNISYDGTQLSPHWIYKRFGVLGNAMVAFSGSADVPLEHMVDLVDVKQQAPISSPLMLHFIGEWFQDSLETAILLQQLLMCEVYEELLESGTPSLSRRGNDIFYQGRKLSVSIATRSSVSTLIHAGINVHTEGTPIPTAGLSELGLNANSFAQSILERFRSDYQICQISRVKVQPR